MDVKSEIKLHGLHKSFLSVFLLAVLMVSVMSPCVLMARAETPVSIDISLSLQMGENGFTIPKQTLAVESNLAEDYGYTDAYDGAQVTALDAIVAAHIIVFGDNQVDINNALTVSDETDEYYGPGFVTNFMGDGVGNFVFFVNGVLVLDLAGDFVLQNGDNVQFFVVQDLNWWLDTYAWFEYEGASVDTLTVGVNEEFDLTVMGTFFVLWGYDYGAYEDVVDGAGIVLIDDTTGAFVLSPLVVTDDYGVATLCFDTAGTYVLGAIDYDLYMDPLMSPWLVVTVEAPEPTVVSVSADASVTWVNGPQNMLSITVTETLSDGTTRTIEWSGLIANNAAGTYNVGNYQVFVNTKGNTQIRECYVVDCYIV